MTFETTRHFLAAIADYYGMASSEYAMRLQTIGEWLKQQAGKRKDLAPEILGALYHECTETVGTQFNHKLDLTDVQKAFAVVEERSILSRPPQQLLDAPPVSQQERELAIALMKALKSAWKRGVSPLEDPAYQELFARAQALR